MAEATKKLTEEQEKHVWQYIYAHMNDDDRDPNKVVEEDFNGDRSRYLEVMAKWHGIKFE